MKSFSKTEAISNTISRLESQTIDEAIGRNHAILLENFFEPLIEKNYYLELLKNSRLPITTIEIEAIEHDTQDNKEPDYDDEIKNLIKHAKYACLYMALARENEKNGEPYKAWALINHTSLMIGEISERAKKIIQATQIEAKSDQNSKNAQGRSKLILPAEELAARLLVEMMPEGGWPSKTSAASTLERPLSEFIIKNKISGVTSSNIKDCLKRRWLKKEGVVQEAWIKTRKPKGRATLI
ncbi:hypothetical protein [Pseudomonas citronellolis]|uniref:hypothetical protein n=1 Tax=Pseudomonas citronellolis TaxID=53408 RepID=UPI0011C1B437|nr:hypothetical protein [Pseudomonas citronellolis]